MTVGIHWYRGIVVGKAVDDVLTALSERWDESVVVMDRGINGYDEGYVVGPVRVYANEQRPDMGVMVEIDGTGCELLGAVEVSEVHFQLELRSSRFDLAHDGCPFSPADLRDAWRAGDVRSRSKVPEGALPDRQWRTCKWVEDPTGDMFTMGARSSTQFARCYDRRGFTRLELELKAEAAAIAADELLGIVGTDPDELAVAALGWVRRFVDFVDQESSSHASRRSLLPWWAAFVESATIARVTLSGVVVRTVEQVREWVERQVAPSLAVLLSALGWDELQRIARGGLGRLRGRHRTMLAAAGATFGSG